MSDNIKVVVKVRPLISREIEDKLSYQWRVKNNTLYQVDQSGREYGSSFTFDKVYDEKTRTNDVYNDIAKPIVEAATAGINGTIFAYGQTSSGKTYTMTGTERAPGIIPLAVLNLFDIIKNKEDRDFLLRVSYIEIYNETIKDLLNVDKEKIKIHETYQGGVKVDATEKVTSSPEEVLEIMREGEANRQIGATNMNEQSSRSHSIFQITIESREHTEGGGDGGCVNVSTLNLVDLAGSERAGQTGATGLRFKEGTHINKSLSALALVIKQLSEDPNKFANYRDSKLTRILQNSLGGNAKTSIICAVTPAAIDETISTLQFANRAKAIKNKPEVNAVTTNATMIQQLTKKLSKLQYQLDTKKSVEQDNRILQQKIESLQRQILNGFGARISVDTSHSDRRKTWCAPRRATIDTLPSIEEDIAPPVHRFATPALKYNPAMLSDFRPVQAMSQLPLPRVSEEGHITPPPREKKSVNFGDEIIELDSDDDDPTKAPCSPYHKCYESSKTPPCVLREKAKEAEKNLQDIVELTERERIYTPSVVEVMEKLEANTVVIVKLQEEVSSLNTKCQERDTEIKHLKDKITKAEDEIKTVNLQKEDLEKNYKEAETKLTDIEFSFETLRQKAKCREEELLSLLEEKRIDVPKNNNSKQLKAADKEINFMDLSKDISLVNSDNENSIINPNGDESSQLHELVTDLQNQLSIKSNLAVELQNKIYAQDEKIKELETENNKIQEMFDSINDKLTAVECENTSLKCTIEQLNSTIQSQKHNFDTLNEDMKSYTTLIQELQTKLRYVNSVPLNLDDDIIENMILSEENIIANNDNLRNIIHSLKSAIEARDKEISSLKIENSENEFSNSEVKETQLKNLLEEVEDLKQQIHEDSKKIVNLTEEICNLTKSKGIVTQELTDLMAQYNKLEQTNQESLNTISQLNNDKLQQTNSLEIREKEAANMTKQIECLSETINTLKINLLKKDNLVSSLHQEKCQFENNVPNLQLCTEKLYNILTLLNGKTINESVPTDLETLVTHLIEGVNSLELCVLEVNKTKESANANISELNIRMEENQNEILEYKTKIEFLLLDIKNISESHHEVDARNHKLVEELTKIKKEMQEKESEINDFEKYKLEVETLTSQNQTLSATINDIRQELVNKQNEIDSLHAEYTTRLEKIKQDINIVRESYEKLEVQNIKLTTNIETISFELENKIKECEDLQGKVLKYSSQLDMYNQNLAEKDSGFMSLQQKESVLVAEVEKLNTLLNKSEKSFESLKKELETQISLYIRNNESIHKILAHKNMEITEQPLYNSEMTLPEKYTEIIRHAAIVAENNVRNEEMLKIILDKATNITDSFGIDSSFMDEENFETSNGIPHLLDKIAVHLDVLNQKISEHVDIQNKQLEDALAEAKTQIHDLTTNNLNLTTDLSQLQVKTDLETAEINDLKNENSSLKANLHECNALLKTLQQEVAQKADEINEWEINMRKFKEEFVNLNKELRQRIIKLEKENSELNKQVVELKEGNGVTSNDSVPSFTDLQNMTSSIRKSISNVMENPVKNKPPSLISLCCSQIIDVLSLNQKENSLTPTSSDSLMNSSIEALVFTEKEFKKVQEENNKLKHNIEVLKHANLRLMQEQEEVRREIQLLIDPSVELQKKIAKHKTNLSTLTATTYAENKALQSQVKVLQHHHTRFHNVCQKDIPHFKKQLMELYSVLKSESQFKRYSLPDVLDKNTTTSTFKNDSTLDGDLLMLDTNVTLATCNDNTLVGHDQTCFEITSIDLDTNNITITDIEPRVESHIDTLLRDNEKMSETITILRDENRKLKENIDQLKLESPDGIQNQDEVLPVLKSESDISHEMMRKIEELAEELSTVKNQKEEIIAKYNKLALEIPSTETLFRKLTALEKEHNTKLAEVTKLTNIISKKNRDLKQLQEENDTLSTQVIENISEADDLKKELDVLKEKLEEKCSQLEQEIQGKTNSESCPQCLAKEKLLNKLVTETDTANTPNGSDTSVRYNKICTLQNELLASKEQCKQITEEFATIKNHLERSNLSMSHDMDDSMGESNIFTFTKDFEVVNTSTSNYGTNMPKILEEKSSDIYALDKADCLNYFVEITGAEKENLNHDIKIIDVMKKLYNVLIVKHGNEVDNLLNKLKDYEELQKNLQSHIDQISTEYNNKRGEIDSVTNAISKIKQSTSTFSESLNINLETDSNPQFVAKFKEDILKVLDDQFDLKSMNVFETLMENIVSKHQNDLGKSMEQYNQLQKHMESLISELTTVKEDLKQMKTHLTVTENDYNLLKTQKERVHEISNAVTLDIIKKEKELNDTISKGCHLLLENNIMEQIDIDLSEPATKNITILFEKLVSQHKEKQSQAAVLNKEIDNLTTEIKNCNVLLEEKELELKMTKQKYENEHKINESVTLDLIQKDKKRQNLEFVNDELNKEIEKMKNGHDSNIVLINNMKHEIDILKDTIAKKEIVTKNLENELSSIKLSKGSVDVLTDKAHNLEREVISLKAANGIILKEKHDLDTNLKTAAETIKANNLELESLKQEVHDLKNSIKESKYIFEDMKYEMDEMTKRMKESEGKQNIENNDKYKDLERKYEDKCKDYSRLEMNIKTHEKTVEIQSCMVKRLQKQKEDDCKKIEELSNKCTSLQQDYDTLQATLTSTKEELTSLQQIKETLEARIALLESDQEAADKGRCSLEKARRRRQSLHDSQRTFSEERQADEHSHMEQLFAPRGKPEELFMDVDGDSAGSTPARNSSASSRKHDSFGARLEHSDKEDEGRPSSVLATRRRRQSTHDLRRSVLPAPTGSPSARQLLDELNSLPQGDHPDINEISKLKSTLQSCQQELEELKERYKELDEECETCAEYLHERDKRCMQLRKENKALESSVAELTKSLERFDPNAIHNARTYASVAVNTDQDWANLHSVVVDRMSFDAEVEKNKKFSKVIEELRLKNRELKATHVKMQKALEKHAARDNSSVARDLEHTRQQLRAARLELDQLQHKYKQLDDECETCSEYLKERDEQCHRLRQAKAALEAKLEELLAGKQKVGAHSALRTAGVDAATETCEDLLSYQVERDGSSRKPAEDSQRLSKMVEKLSREKLALEQQLLVTAAPTYVATGSAIVQNQQLTDIMKENQKLKKMNAKLITICKKRGKDQSESREIPT